jgi:regulator of protease activity HflC (stomatin/prohibitin superfamily)
MDRNLDPIALSPRRPVPFTGLALLFVGLVALLFMGPFRTVPAGHVGVKDFFGQVSTQPLPPGIRFVVPFTSVVKMSVQTQEIKEVAEVPSQEGLILSLETSLLFPLKPPKSSLPAPTPRLW